jgi:hypothetical protein
MEARSGYRYAKAAGASPLLNYNPYFSIGDAVAGLGIFLLIPQFLKPVYIFRLRVIGIGLRTLYAVSGTGFLCVLTGAICVHYNDSFPAFLRNPLEWELAGGFLYAAAYSALGLVYIFPARASLGSITKYVRAGAQLLASASEEGRVEFAADVLANIKKLIRMADLTGSQPRRMTSFKLHFYRRSRADIAAYSQSFLGLLADPVFCRTLVSRLPWDAARILRAFSDEKPAGQVGRTFVHQLTRYTLIAAETMGAKEDEWMGFSDAPALSHAAFGDTYLNRYYLPWEGLTAADLNAADVAMLERIARAAQLTIDEYAGGGFSYQSYNIAKLQESYEVLSRRIYQMKKAEADILPFANILGRSVKYIVETTREYCRAAPAAERQLLYAPVDAPGDLSVLDSIAEMVISVLENTSNEFSGFDDKFWNMAREIWDSVLPRFGVQAPGMDPLQQRFVLKLIEKTRENMEGWNVPLSRQALAVIGPYAAKVESKERTAFKICRDLFYYEFKEFPAFYERDVERAKTFLPNNVRYEPESATLVHRYSFGGEDRTDLPSLEIAPISLTAETIGHSAPQPESTPAALRPA